jgi:hypothetical protein
MAGNPFRKTTPITPAHVHRFAFSHVERDRNGKVVATISTCSCGATQSR